MHIKSTIFFGGAGQPSYWENLGWTAPWKLYSTSWDNLLWTAAWGAWLLWLSGIHASPFCSNACKAKNRWCGLRAPGRYPPRICNEMWLGTSLWLWRIWQAAETAGSEWQGISQPQGFHSKHERGVWQFAAQVLQSQVCLHQVGEEIPPDAVQVPDCWERLQARALCHNHHDLIDPHEKAQRWAKI